MQRDWRATMRATMRVLKLSGVVPQKSPDLIASPFGSTVRQGGPHRSGVNVCMLLITYYELAFT